MNRPSEIAVDVAVGSNSEIERVELGGRVCDVMHGELVIPLNE